MPKTKKSAKQSLLTKSEVQELVKGIYVGYNPCNTLETSILTASKLMMSQLKMNLQHSEVMALVENLNVISCGGLDNFFFKMYLKLAEYNQKMVA